MGNLDLENPIASGGSQPIFNDFYVIQTNGAINIHHAGLYEFLNEKGGFSNGKINGNRVNRLVRIQNNVIEDSTIDDAIDFIKNHVDNLPKELGYGVTSSSLKNLLVRGSENYFNKTKFKFLLTSEIAISKDTREEAFFYYGNCYAKVTKAGITCHPYKQLKYPIWREKIKSRDFELLEMEPFNSIIEQFLWNVSNRDVNRYESLQSLIGYLLHNYKDSKLAKAVVFVDEKIGEVGDANGGTGKSLIINAILAMLSGVLFPGRLFNIKNSFAFQEVDWSTDLIVMDDVSKNERFEDYYNIITDGITVEKKYRGKYFIPFEHSPKICISTNHVLQSPPGNSSERRQIIWEASSFYNGEHLPAHDFKKNLLDEWDADEWNKFDNAMLGFVKNYLNTGIIDPPKINITMRKLYCSVGAELVEFMDDKIREGVVKFDKKRTHDEFLQTYHGLRNFFPSTNKFTMKIKQYLDAKGIQFIETPSNTRKFIQILTDGGTGNDLGPKDPNVKEAIHSPKTPIHINTEVHGGALFTLKDVPHSYHLVETKADRAELIKRLLDQTSIAFDTETTDLNVYPIDIVGLSVSFKSGEAYYVPFPVEFHLAKEILEEFSSIFESVSIEKIAHNLKYDMQILNRYGLEIKGPQFDTMIAHYLCFPDAPSHGLKQLCEVHFNYRQVHYEDIVGKGNKAKHIREVALVELAEYASEDADYTYRLKNLFEPMLEEKGLMKLFREMEMPLVAVLADIESEGVNLDVPILMDLLQKTNVELEEKEKSVYNMAGEVFNLNSGKDLNRILFDVLAIEPIGKPGKSGNYSVNAETLKELSKAHPIALEIKNYKELSSIRSNFFEKLPKMVNQTTGRIHTKYNQAIASTGRLSSSKPNLQNVPKKRDGLGSLVRSAFIPRDKDHVIISADYSQIELRVMAHISGDESLTDAFNQGLDVHSATAAKVFGVPVNEITKDDYRRKYAKSVNFGLIYCMGAKSLAGRLSAETGDEVSTYDAQDTIDTYFENFKGVKSFMEKAVEDGQTKGYAETLFNRKRTLENINSFNKFERAAAERISVNMPIQGTAADIVKIAMINVHGELTKQKMATRMIMQIHDELVFDVPKIELEKALEIIKFCMESAVKLSVPLLVDINHGESWLTAH
jgi:DNA polymerase I